MLDHAIFPDETLATHLTGEWFLARVQAHVPSQVRLVVELLRADLTLVRLVARVLC